MLLFVGWSGGKNDCSSSVAARRAWDLLEANKIRQLLASCTGSRRLLMLLLLLLLLSFLIVFVSVSAVLLSVGKSVSKSDERRSIGGRIIAVEDENDNIDDDDANSAAFTID